jgi:hypothetical protein
MRLTAQVRMSMQFSLWAVYPDACWEHSALLGKAPPTGHSRAGPTLAPKEPAGLGDGNHHVAGAQRLCVSVYTVIEYIVVLILVWGAGTHVDSRMSSCHLEMFFGLKFFKENSLINLSTMVHTCRLSYSGDGSRKIAQV